MLSIIVAVAENNVIGKDNKLIWHLPEDLKRFKRLTTGHTIIMGRKTFESLGRVLPNRKHIIFSQNPDFKVKDENVEVVHSLLQIQELIENTTHVRTILNGIEGYRLFSKINGNNIFLPLYSEKDGMLYNIYYWTTCSTSQVIDARQVL